MQGRGLALVLPASFHRASLKHDTPKYPNYTCTSCPFVTGILSAGTKCPIVRRAAETTCSNIHVCWIGGRGIGCAPNGPNWTACWSALRTVENTAGGGRGSAELWRDERSVHVTIRPTSFTSPPALGETKCHFVSSRSPESERAICGFALLSRRVLPPHPPCRRGGLRALQAARSSSRVLRGCHKTRLAPFNPIRETHSDFGPPPVRHLPLSLEVTQWHQLMAAGRRRHQLWRRDNMFQASGGVTRGPLLSDTRANEMRLMGSSFPAWDFLRRRPGPGPGPGLGHQRVCLPGGRPSSAKGRAHKPTLSFGVLIKGSIQN